MSLRRRFDEAHAILDEAGGFETKGGRVQIRLHLERGRTLNSSGQPALAKDEFAAAWELALGLGEEALAVDAAHMVAIVEDVPGQIEWNRRALDLAKRSSDPKAQKWVPSLLNNLAWTHHDLGQFDKALEMFEEAQKLRAERDDPIGERIARWCIARCLRSLGRTGEALEMQRRLLEEQQGDGPGYVEEELGECLAVLGRMDEARPFFRTAYEKLKTNGEIDHEPERLERLAHMAQG
jgi:tetratricopeptide (TPR) repeat protein